MAQVTFRPFFLFDLWQVTESISQAQPKAKVTTPTLEVFVQEMTFDKEIESNTEKEDSNWVYAKNP